MEKQQVVRIVGLLVFLSARIAWAQVTTATILGTVKDTTGAVLPDARVAVLNEDTGISRTVTTDSGGHYSAPSLSLGNYEVTATREGFRTEIRRGIVLTVGREAVVDFALQVGAVAEQITVTGEAPAIETTTSEVSGLVSEAQIKELPLNARSYEQLAFLQPNVYYQRNFQATVNTGYTPRISAAGMRTNMNAFIVDGVDIMDELGQTPGSAAGQIMGVETLREFRILTNNSKAQYGRAVGAIIDVVSRAGTNTLHGTAFEFLRNDKLDARSFFDTTKPPLRRNQFGAVIGGPIRRDKLFFFGSYEALRERLTTFNVEFVPTALAKQGILPSGNVPVAPAMAPYLALYPNPQVDVGGGVGTYTFPFGGTTREDYLTGRSDYQYSSKVSYFARYSLDDTDKLHRKGPGILPPWAERLTSRYQIATLAETRIISPVLINEFRAGFVRSPMISRNALTGVDPQIHFPGTVGEGVIANGFSYAVGAAALASLGSSGFAFSRYVGNTFQVADNLSYVKGPHSFKMGFNIENFQDNVASRAEQGFYAVSNTYTFQSLQDLLAGTPRSFGGTLVLPPAGISGRQWLYGFYVQDDYTWRPNFTLNLGLRYEWASNYSNTNNRFIILNDLFGTPKTGQKYGWGGRVCAGCLDPRIGFAWDPFSNGKTALKGGFGVFHSQLVRFMGYFDLRNSADTPGGISISADNPSFPDPRAAKPGAVIRIIPTGLGLGGNPIIPNIPHTPSALQWNLALEQQINRNMTLRLAYVGSKGYHLPYGYEANTNSYQILPDGSRYFPPGVHRIRSDYGSSAYRGYDAISDYNSFAVTLGQRVRRGLAFEASYVFSRETDDGSITTNQNALQTNDPWPYDERRYLNHGLAAMDMRHRFVSNFTYDLPSLTSQNVFVKKTLSGWQVSSIITLQAGIPLTPMVGFDQANAFGLTPSATQHVSFNPSLPPSVVLCPCQDMPTSLGGGNQGSPQRFFDPRMFVLPTPGTYGNVGRGVFTSPGLANVDVAMVKKTVLTERAELQFRAEAFNLLNRVNWGLPSVVIFQNASGAFAPSAGQITGTSTEGRQLQLALKLVF